MNLGRTWIRGQAEHGRGWDGLFPPLLLGLCFMAGLLLGLLLSALRKEGSDLSEYLSAYFRAVIGGDVSGLSLWSVIWDLIRWPLAAFLLGCTVLGVVGIPALLLIRGFLLSYAITTFARLFGERGMALALAVFGVSALLMLPVLFVVGCDAFGTAARRLPNADETPARIRQRLAALAPCIGISVLAAALQRTAMPALLAVVCAKVFGV